ncbi:MAG: biopolymer transporter ExbD [Phycisphaerae bacterium]
MIFRPPKPTEMTLNLAPMVDVMMCLIIFFLLAGSLVDAEHQAIELPFAVSAEPVERSALGTRVTINVRRAPGAKDGLPAEYVVAGWDGQNIVERLLPPEQIADFLRARAAEATPDSPIRCLIRAEQEVSYRDIEVVLRGCGLAKIAKVVFGANHEASRGAGR